MTDSRTTEVRTPALRTHVADRAGDVEVGQRRPERARRAVAGTVAGVLLVVGGAVVAGSVRGDRTASPAATTSPTPATASETLAVAVTYLPPGYRLLDGDRDLVPAPGGEGTIEVGRANYARGSRTDALVIVSTTRGDRLPPATLADYAGEGATEVAIGDRTVIRVAAAGMPFYVWNERPGLSVTVEGRGTAADADVRAVIAGIRPRS